MKIHWYVNEYSTYCSTIFHHFVWYNSFFKEGPKLITSDMEHPRGLPKEGGRGHRWRGCRTLRSLRFRCHKGMTWDWKKPLVNFLQLAKTHENAYWDWYCSMYQIDLLMNNADCPYSAMLVCQRVRTIGGHPVHFMIRGLQDRHFCWNFI